MAQTSVDTSRITLGEMVAAAGAGAMLVFMLFPWFSVAASGSLDLDGNAWQSLGFIDVVLFFAALAVIGVVVVKAAEPGLLRELPWPAANVVLAAGGLATLLILFRLLSPPELELGAFTGFDLETKREIGVFLGFLAALAMTAGGFLQKREGDSATAAAAAAAPPEDLARGQAGGTQALE